MSYSGIWPVAPTPFNDDGTLDLEGMKRVLDLMVDQGVDGICILANFSEQFLISDAERDTLTRLCISHVAGRVPVIVTISHFATKIAVARARQAKELGASIVMMMAPYHGALLKGTPEQTLEQFKAVGEVGIPIMLQDAPLSGVELTVPLLARMAREIEMLKLFKIESAGTANKLRGSVKSTAMRDSANPLVRQSQTAGRSRSGGQLMANPPFNLKDWRGPDELRSDGRWNGYDTPPTGNANYAWILHMVSKLSEHGVAGFVLANGSMSTNTKGEGEIRQKLVENDLVDCMIALPGQLFYTTQIPVCLWFLTKN